MGRNQKIRKQKRNQPNQKGFSTSASRKVQKKRLNPSFDALLSTNIKITSQPIIDKSFERLPLAVKDQLESLHNLALSKPKQAIPQLEGLRQKYPDVAQIYNFLAIAYSNNSEVEKADSIMLENYERHPDYLFARVNYAERCLHYGEPEKVPEIFDHCFDLKLLYPRRNTFHISEVANFYGVTAHYFATIGDREKAEAIFEFLMEVAPGYRFTKKIKKVLFPSPIQRFLRHLLKTSNDA